MNKDKQIKFGTGEILSFEKFFKENFSKFYAFTARFIEDSYACEDIVQETFISIWESDGNQYDSLLMLHAFIYRTIRNRALNYLKHHKIKKQYSQNYLKELESEEYMFSSVLNEEAHYVLFEAIRRLTPQCQTVIKLHLDGKKNKEIAEEMGISIITVKSHKLLAYKELRAMLEHSVSFILLICVNSVKKINFNSYHFPSELFTYKAKINGNNSEIHPSGSFDLQTPASGFKPERRGGFERLVEGESAS